MRPSLSLLYVLLGGVAAAQTPPVSLGTWHPPFAHDLSGFVHPPTTQRGFNAIHMALIPAGPHRGKVFVMDRNGSQPASGSWSQRWSIIDVSDPSQPTFIDETLTLPQSEGDLFCSGHTWDAFGRLLVVGGTTEYLDGTGTQWGGGKLALWFDPSQPLAQAWSPHADPMLATARWYPTATLLDSGEILVFGGTEFTPTGGPGTGGLLNDFEAFDGQQWRVLPGPPLQPPENTNNYMLGLYPRMHLLRSGRVFLAAHPPRSWRLDLGLPGFWQKMDRLQLTTRGGSTLLFPNIPGFGDHDVVMVIGGKDGGISGTVTDGVHYCSADAPAAGAFPGGWDWQDWPSMHSTRWRANATILPDATVFVVGGDRNPDPNNPDPVMNPELFVIESDGTNPHWVLLPPQAGPRTYHSTAVLLPSGRVLVGGGDTRGSAPGGTRWDYQIYDPPYLGSGQPRPVITATPTSFSYGQQYTVSYGGLPTGHSATQVVLIRPGTATHHTDYDQRYKALDIVARTPTSLTFTTPAHAAIAPPGYYMMFVLSDAGVPSVAEFIELR